MADDDGLENTSAGLFQSSGIAAEIERIRQQLRDLTPSKAPQVSATSFLGVQASGSQSAPKFELSHSENDVTASHQTSTHHEEVQGSQYKNPSSTADDVRMEDLTASAGAKDVLGGLRGVHDAAAQRGIGTSGHGEYSADATSQPAISSPSVSQEAHNHQGAQFSASGSYVEPRNSAQSYHVQAQEHSGDNSKQRAVTNLSEADPSSETNQLPSLRASDLQMFPPSFQRATHTLVDELQREMAQLIDASERDKMEWRKKQQQLFEQIQQLQDDNEALRKSDSKRASTVRSFEAELTTAIDHFRAQQNRWTQERLGYQSKLDMYENQIAQLQDKVHRLTREQEEARDRAAQLDQQLRLAQQDKQSAEERLQSQQQQYQSLAKSLQQETDAILDRHRREVAELNDLLAEERSAKNHAQKRVESLANRLEAADAATAQANERVTALEAQLEEARETAAIDKQRSVASAKLEAEKEHLRAIGEERERANENEERIRADYEQEISRIRQAHEQAMQHIKDNHAQDTKDMTAKINEERRLRIDAEERARRSEAASVNIQQLVSQRESVRASILSDIKQQTEATSSAVISAVDKLISLSNAYLQENNAFGSHQDRTEDEWMGAPLSTLLLQNEQPPEDADLPDDDDGFDHRPLSTSHLLGFGQNAGPSFSDEAWSAPSHRTHHGQDHASAQHDKGEEAENHRDMHAPKRDYAKPWLAGLERSAPQYAASGTSQQSDSSSGRRHLHHGKQEEHKPTKPWK